MRGTSSGVAPPWFSSTMRRTTLSFVSFSTLFVPLAVGSLATAATPPAPAQTEGFGAPFARSSAEGLPWICPITLAGPLILVDDVYVNGEGPFRFMLDTGAQGAGRVDASLVARLGLAADGEVQGSDGTGRRGRSMSVHVLDSLAIGPLHYEDVRVLSRDYNLHGEVVRGKIDGILGFALFQDLLLTIDYPARELRVTTGSLPEADDASVFDSDQSRGAPSAPIAIVGEPYVAVLDTGSMGGITVSEAIAEDLPLGAEPVEVGQARTVTGAFAIREAPLDGALTIGEHTLSDPDLLLAGPMPGVNLGGRVLREFAITFDQANARVKFERPPSVRPENAAQRVRISGGSVGVPMDLTSGRPVVDVEIGGETYPFIVDTGAGTTVLMPALVRALDLKAHGTTRVGDPSNPTAVEAEQFTVPELSVGGLRFESVPAISWDDGFLDQLGEIRGILGLPLFSEHLLVFDFPAEELVVRPGALAPRDDSVPFFFDDWVPALEVELGGAPLLVHIDTGNPGSLTLPAEGEERFAFTAPPTVIGRGRVASGTFEVKGATLEEPFPIAGQRFEGLGVQLTDRFAHANAGTGLFRDCVFTIDQTNRRLRLERGEGATKRPRPRRYGIMMAAGSDGSLEVRGTQPDSVASRSALQPGDRVVAMNGERVADLDGARRAEIMRGSPVVLTIERAGETIEIELSFDD